MLSIVSIQVDSDYFYISEPRNYDQHGSIYQNRIKGTYISYRNSTNGWETCGEKITDGAPRSFTMICNPSSLTDTVRMTDDVASELQSDNIGKILMDIAELQIFGVSLGKSGPTAVNIWPQTQK